MHISFQVVCSLRRSFAQLLSSTGTHFGPKSLCCPRMVLKGGNIRLTKSFRSAGMGDLCARLKSVAFARWIARLYARKVLLGS